jgi:hypothetical protein
MVRAAVDFQQLPLLANAHPPRFLLFADLFATTNNNRFMAFKIIEKAFPMLQSNQVPLVLTPNCLRCLISSLARPKNYMKKTARHITNVLERHGRSSPMMALAVVTALQSASNDKFDKTTGFVLRCRVASLSSSNSFILLTPCSLQLPYRTQLARHVGRFVCH